MANIIVTDKGLEIVLAHDFTFVPASAFSADSQVLVGTGSGTYQAESGATLRTSLGLGLGDTPQLAGLNLATGTLTTGNIDRAAGGTLNLKISGTNKVRIDNANVYLDGTTRIYEYPAVIRHSTGDSYLQIQTLAGAAYNAYLKLSGGSDWKVKSKGNGAFSIAASAVSDTEVFTLDYNTFSATFGGNIIIPNAGYIGSVSDTDALAIGNTGIITTSQRIQAGAGASSSGQKILSGNYYGQGIGTIGTSYSSGGLILGYGVWPSTSIANSFVSSVELNVYRAALVVSDGFRFYTGDTQNVAVDAAVTTNLAMQIEADGDIVLSQDLQVDGEFSTKGNITLNSDLADVTGTLTFGMTTGGSGTISHDGTLFAFNKRLRIPLYESANPSKMIEFYNDGTPQFYGFGMGPTASEGYLNYYAAYDASTGSWADTDVYGHRFYVGDTQRMRVGGLTTEINTTFKALEILVSASSFVGSEKLRVNGDILSDGNLTINGDLGDVTSTLTFGRTTGGNATISWNGTTQILDKQVQVPALSIGGTPSASSAIRNNNTALNSAISYYHIYNFVQKTAGASDYADDLYAVYNHSRMNQSGGEIGHLFGSDNFAQVSNGSIGAVGNVRNAYGSRAYLYMDGGTITADAHGGYSYTNIDAGIISGNLFGHRITIDQEAASTLTGNAYGLYLYMDLDSDPGGSAYGIYFSEHSHIDYFIYQSGSAPSILGGAAVIGGYSFVGSEKLRVYGDVYADGDVSALTFTDRTPFYDGDALSEIIKIKGKDGEIDHTTLPLFVRRIIKGKDGIDSDGRDLGATISMLTVAVQQLVTMNDSLQVRISELEASTSRMSTLKNDNH